jgi:hypothetical protein
MTDWEHTASQIPPYVPEELFGRGVRNDDSNELSAVSSPQETPHRRDGQARDQAAKWPEDALYAGGLWCSS